MRFPNWLGSIHFLFSKKNTRMHGWRKHSCHRKDERKNQRVVESLEQRRLLAFDLSAAFVGNQQIELVGGDPIAEPPQQITLRFTPGSVVDPTSLASGISIVRSGGIQVDGQTDGFVADADPLKPSRFPDVLVEPGVLIVDDLPSENQVIIRFAENLPDDLYRFTITSSVDPNTGGA